jgi:hypothetical protein
MHLDMQTLSVVTVFVTALLGALLIFAGLQNRSILAPMWWGIDAPLAHCVLSLHGRRNVQVRLRRRMHGPQFPAG